MRSSGAAGARRRASLTELRSEQRPSSHNCGRNKTTAEKHADFAQTKGLQTLGHLPESVYMAAAGMIHSVHNIALSTTEHLPNDLR